MKFLVLNAMPKPTDDVRRYVCKNDDICTAYLPMPWNGK